VPRDLPRGEVPDAVTPPLGCSFHPRCQRAFEVCGWESRDLRTLLELRWTQLPEEEFERERALIGDLNLLDTPTTECMLPAADGGSGDDAMQVLEGLRKGAPDDPFWKGVAETSVEAGGVRIRFREGIVPREIGEGRATVRCHLFDPDAMAAAKRADGA
jgi:peptide/nickel transport system ATP-binding protein